MKQANGIKSLAKGVASCSTQAAAYGQCITLNYKDVQKEMCQREFQLFKDCVQKSLKKKW